MTEPQGPPQDGATGSIFLSTARFPGRTLLGTFTRSEDLAAGSEYQRSETVTVPVLPDGDYFWLVVTDAGNVVYERAQENNNSNATAGLQNRHADLVVDGVTAPGTADSGSDIAVSWTVRNAGTGATPDNWTDRVYLSGDTALSADDILLGEYAHSGVIPAAQSYTGTLTVPSTQRA